MALSVSELLLIWGVQVMFEGVRFWSDVEQDKHCCEKKYSGNPKNHVDPLVAIKVARGCARSRYGFL
ncbi:hypothetical protein D6C98_01298 [Aureobasidium pullulans]|uniref:Uncharacterized protein n=1 Tax=Aureobasidium pullulans TaxID=5580 RepID=A0A4S9NZ66_AURPU|nr:hypothetical protein D6D24_01042 [Aureobasidium pullulans]THW69881.1 hypothetical protein D6D25_00788 [Aureobasidium pullulans]THY06699.1 hypothetical protein D6D03_02197 [Aureobasidium pullulans]THY63056.1 hypothetical protein D6C98_01298 [Aureobasidium pullulans]THZ13969.1 hypothetical protein D6C89_10313 [Aureobasidium pullulans]